MRLKQYHKYHGRKWADLTKPFSGLKILLNSQFCTLNFSSGLSILCRKDFCSTVPRVVEKTLIGKATAYNLTERLKTETGEEIEGAFLHIKGPEILNMWLGESERKVREIFQAAREKRAEGKLAFIFIDEAESILGTRRAMRSHSISNTLVPMFCAEMDGIEPLQEVVIILATNRPDLIDPAVLRPGRIDRKIKVTRPNKEAAKDIFSIYLTPKLPIKTEPGGNCR